jgi:hypothetical protein
MDILEAISTEDHIKRVGELTAAVTYLSNSKFVNCWFEYNSINPCKNMDIIYNMSKCPTLARRFCSRSNTGDGVRTFIKLKKAVEFIKRRDGDNLLLIHFVELDTYGVYTPTKLFDFINNMISEVDDHNRDNLDNYKKLICNLRQFIFEHQQQKTVFKCTDKSTLEKLSMEIKRNTGYDIQVMEVGEEYEITVPKISDNKAASDKFYETEIKGGLSKAVVSKIKEMIMNENKFDASILSINNDTKELTNAAFIEIFKSSPINITINNYNTTNNIAGNVYNAANDININTLSAPEQRNLNAVTWIKSNPPNSREKTTDYYARYRAVNPDNDLAAASSVFGRVMKSEKYTFMSSNCSKYWLNK